LAQSQGGYILKHIVISIIGIVLVNFDMDYLIKKNIDMRKQKNETVVLKKGNQDIALDYAELRKAVLVLRAVNHKLRQRIIDLLEEFEQMTVTDIYIKLRLEQSVASQHLAILRRAGVVATDRQGKFIYYSLDNNRLSQISRLVEELAA
jgi:DNA-binding transcriptional ArsR family regulator